MTKQTHREQWTVISAHLDFSDVIRGDLLDKRRSLMKSWGRFTCANKSNVTHLRKPA